MINHNKITNEPKTLIIVREPSIITISTNDSVTKIGSILLEQFVP